MRRPRRWLALLVVLGSAVVIMASPAAHELMRRRVVAAGTLISDHPLAGVLVFVLLSVASAMMAFFSSAVIIPVAVYEWGRETTLILLWVSWLAGGCCSYAIGRTLGHRVAAWLVGTSRLEFYTDRVSREAGFLTVLLFQFAVPSEVPGYVLGAMRYRFPVYFVALALAEVPFAAGAVYLGEGFLERRYGLIVLIGAAGLVLTAFALRSLHRRIGEPPRNGDTRVMAHV